MKQCYTRHPSGVPPVVFWGNGNIHVDGREFGATREEDGRLTPEENASEFIRQHYGGATVAEAFRAGLDLRRFDVKNKDHRRKR